MHGTDKRSGDLFSCVDLETRVRMDHPLRTIREMTNTALAALSGDFAALYSGMGRPSVPPEKLLRAMLLQVFYSIRSERQLMERLDFDLLFRWFVGLGVDDPAWDHSTFSKNRDRLLEGDIAAKFLAAVLVQPRIKRLLSSEHFSVDGTLIEEWASMKSFRPKAAEDGGGAAVLSFRCIETLKAAQKEALQSSRLASVGQLAAGIAHEINTPIQYVGDNLRFFDASIGSIDKACHAMRDALAEGGASPELLAKVEAVLQEADVPYLMEELPAAVRQSLDGVEHVAKIVRSMKEFSYPGSTAKVTTDINRALESTLTVTTNEWKHSVRIEKDFSPDLPHILCLPADINQVLLNLIVNAPQSLEGRGEMGVIRISTR